MRFDAPNYFLEHSSSQLLCFFQENSKKFHFLELNSLERHDIKYKFQEKDLFIDFRIPLYHRSIAIPSGEIFMIGGIDPSNKTHAINKVYQLDLKTSSLLPKMSMGQARYSHSVCFAMKYIFTVGGVFEINEGYLNNFEKYDVDFGEWIPLTPSHIKSMGSSLCNFNDHFIYKFGGKIDNSGFSNSFERYDILKNVWSLFNIHSDSQILKFPSFANSYQINREEIMIYGGNINENQCKGIYLLRVKEFLKHEEIVLEEKIREIKMEINAPGSFWTQPLMHENVLFNTQNLQIDKGRELCHFGKKRVVICNSEIWKDL